MLNILTAIFHDEPQCEEERKIAIQLRAVDEKAAEALRPSIEVLANKQAERSFYTGVRFGAQLMLQLLEDVQSDF